MTPALGGRRLVGELDLDISKMMFPGLHNDGHTHTPLVRCTSCRDLGWKVYRFNQTNGVTEGIGCHAMACYCGAETKPAGMVAVKDTIGEEPIIGKDGYELIHIY